MTCKDCTHYDVCESRICYDENFGSSTEITDIENRCREFMPVREIEHGRWELFGDDDDDGATYYCSKCNFQLSEDLFYRGYDSGKWINNNVFCFCPHCGAKMDL